MYPDRIRGDSEGNGEQGRHWTLLPAAWIIGGLTQWISRQRTPVQTPNCAHTTRGSQHWVICVNTGVFQTDLHDVLSKWCQALQQEIPQAIKPYVHLQINQFELQILAWELMPAMRSGISKLSVKMWSKISLIFAKYTVSGNLSVSRVLQAKSLSHRKT